MREIKFRAWRKNNTVRYDWDNLKGISINQWDGYFDCVEQFTGHKTINGKELYENDIVFVEEAEEAGDKRYYLVIVWIPEWSMFASLHLDEYHKFLTEGYKALDEVMFWTYTLENAEKDFHYAGNVHEFVFSFYEKTKTH
jgi:hypothetical protein